MLLYDRDRTRTDTYCFQINSGGEFFVKESGTVKIIFENGVFVSASFPFCGSYTRNGWRILAAINDEINIIEQDMKSGVL